MITLKLLERLNDSLKKETGEFITVNRILLSEVYRELMVRMEAEIKPVAVLDIQRNREDKPRLLMEYASARELPDDTYQLFTAPPAPAVQTVPDAITVDNAPEIFEIAAQVERIGLSGAYGAYASGWNACRGAMLSLSGGSNEKAEHVSQGYTLQDDTRRLDWLDEQNAKKNKSHGTTYGWGYEVNHNRIALSDCHFPAKSVRAAIDAAILVSGVTDGKPVTGNSPVIPDGWKLVPNEPTTKQWAAGYKAMDGGIDKVTLAYRAMVEVAPSPGGADDSHATAT